LKSEAEMLKYRNFGKKSLNEIKDKLEELQLGLGLKFEPGLIEVQPEAEKPAGEEDETKAKKK
jgi:DNA-directed RNA polymerase subunit alpha